jgi:hypothetical protein
VGSFSKAAHFKASSSFSSTENLEKTSMALLFQMLGLLAATAVRVANLKVRDFGLGLGERGTYIVKPK